MQLEGNVRSSGQSCQPAVPVQDSPAQHCRLPQPSSPAENGGLAVRYAKLARHINFQRWLTYANQLPMGRRYHMLSLVAHAMDEH